MQRISNFKFQISNFNRRRRGFTLVELLVVITIIALLAGVMLGALAKTREVAKADATKATVAKLNDLVMRKYESYLTRRLPLDVSALNLNQKAYATLRLQAIRDLMRMEMPERWCDVTTGPLVAGLQSPSLQRIYSDKYTNWAKYGMKSGPVADHQQAKCLYLWVMTAIPEAKTMFSGSEIGDVDGDGWKTFIDGWGNPIGFLRWAPGATVTLNAAGAPVGTGWSDVQIDDTAGNNLHHDPFDPNLIENKQAGSAYPNAAAYHLYPLIFAGVLSKVNGYDDYGIVLGNNSVTGDARDSKIKAPTTDPFNPSGPYASSPAVGAVMLASGTLPAGGVPLVHNQHMEQR